ncbi:MAG: DUF4358 domain-containing protein [Oscillospiraceae bacterium]|nr:DUF4358 domain-containing protein [Oscillospiraceae bacterium]
MNSVFKRILCVMLAGATACTMLASCSDDKSSSDKPESSSVAQTKTVEMSQLKDAMLKADDTVPTMLTASSEDENGEQLFAYLADYDYANVDEYFFCYAAEGTADEIAVIKLKDSASSNDCLKAVKEHVATRSKQYETYDPDQVPRCSKAIVFSNDVYVVLVISDKNDLVKDAFYNAFK